MRALVAGLVALSIVSGGMAVAQTAAPSEAARRWWSHVEFLASDAMKGRNTGSDELKAAAEYIARQFADAGLVPAASGGFFQPVAFRTRRIIEAESSLALIRDGKAEPLALGPDATFSMRIDPAPSVDARLVFAGYGLVVPEANYDDLAGLDVKGAVVVHLSGSPSSVPGPLAAHFSSAAERWAALRRAGAVGIINIPNPKSTDVPWERSSANRLATTMALADPAFDETTGQQLSVTVNPASAGKLFAGAPSTFAEIVDLAEARKPLPRFALPVSIRATTRVETASVDCRNVAGLLKGSDPALSNEYVVLSAHMDHVGVGARHRRRQHLQRRHGQRLGRGDAHRDGAHDDGGSDEAEAVRRLSRRDRRGERPARVALLRRQAHRSRRRRRRRRQHGHVPAALSAEDTHGAGPGGVEPWRQRPPRRRGRERHRPGRTSSRSGTASHAAINTASSAAACRRSR